MLFPYLADALMEHFLEVIAIFSYVKREDFIFYSSSHLDQST